MGVCNVFVCSEKGFQKATMQGQDFIDEDFRRADIIYYKYCQTQKGSTSHLAAPKAPGIEDKLRTQEPMMSFFIIASVTLIKIQRNANSHYIMQYNVI